MLTAINTPRVSGCPLTPLRTDASITRVKPSKHGSGGADSMRAKKAPFAVSPACLVAERRKVVVVTRAAAAAAAAAPVLGVGVQWVLAASACLASLSLSFFLFSAVPTLLAVRRAAKRMEVVMAIMEAEFPDTMKAMRLAGLELSDCIEEVTDLGSDFVAGVRASASTVVAAEKHIKDVAKSVTEDVLPRVKAKAPLAKRSLESSLRDRVQLGNNDLAKSLLARSTIRTLRTTKTLLRTANIGGKAASLWRVYKGIRYQLSKVDSSDLQYKPPSEDSKGDGASDGPSSEAMNENESGPRAAVG